MKLCFLLLFFRLSGSILFLRVLWAIVTFYIASTLAGWLLYAPLKSFYAPELYPDVRWSLKDKQPSQCNRQQLPCP
ncbi:hypothetical protein HDV57DRAFT_495693 [Trichoderma longibrachiatum]